ncbi:MAG: hypothetical protein EON56_05370 [Alphaproteobacteria bacterium]|nr:MAG: hypothetical protein EON56_05370 [Alphaproteobacteria bacterium]
MFKMETLSVGIDLHVGSATQLDDGERFCLPRQLRYRSGYVLYRGWANEAERGTINACLHVFSSDIEEDVRVRCRRRVTENHDKKAILCGRRDVNKNLASLTIAPSKRV